MLRGRLDLRACRSYHSFKMKNDEKEHRSRPKGMAEASSRLRVSVDGKFFRLGEKKFYVKGVTYGPLSPNEAGQPYASPGQTARGLWQIRPPGANLTRGFHIPPQWVLGL